MNNINWEANDGTKDLSKTDAPTMRQLAAMQLVARMKEAADKVGAGFVGGFIDEQGNRFMMSNLEEDCMKEQEILKQLEQYKREIESQDWLRVHSVNLYTVYVNAMKMRQTPADQKQNQFIEVLQSVHTQLTNLLEDPLFIDSIHGEQEMGLDLALELIDNIIARIDPKDITSQVELMDRLELTAVDADWTNYPLHATKLTNESRFFV